MKVQRRWQAESLMFRLKQRMNKLNYVQRVGWGKPPKVVKDTYSFAKGSGELLVTDYEAFKKGLKDFSDKKFKKEIETENRARGRDRDRDRHSNRDSRLIDKDRNRDKDFSNHRSDSNHSSLVWLPFFLFVMC